MLKMNTTNRYDKYKDSGIEWIGEIPDSWNVVKAKHLFLQSLNKGGKELVLLSATQNDGVIPKDRLEGVVQVKEDADLSTFKSVKKGDFVISLRSFQGGFEYSNYAGVITPAYTVFRKKENICENYFRKLFKSDGFIAKINSLTTGIRDGKNIQYDDFADMFLPLPTIAIQNQIAGYLDRKCRAIDETIEKQKSVIEKLKEYKQSIITQAVTKGLDKSDPMKDSGIEWIGQIPQHWEISKIKFSAIVNPKYNENLSSDTLVSFAPMECLTNCNLECKDAILSNVLGSYTYFANNDIIMAKVTPCFENGNIALATNLNNGVGFGSSELYVFRSINIFDKFLLYLLQNTQFKDNAIATMYGTGGLKRVSIEFVKNYKFACPDLKEQEQIAEFLDKKCSEIDKTIEDKEKLIEKLLEYKKSLIYECVTGKRKVI